MSLLKAIDMASALRGIPFIEEIPLSGKNVFLRLDLNVPLKDGVILDDTRIQAALPTIRYVMEQGGKLVLASHLGRPKTEEDRERLSLAPIGERLSEILGVEVLMVEEPSSDAPKALLAGLKGGRQILMLENLRFDSNETKNGHEMALAIAEYTDVYINDAFGASHRAHCSVVGLPAEVSKKAIGFLVRKEIEILDRIKEGNETPYVTILGGAKISDKIPLIEKLIDKVDCFIIGGAMAYTFLKAQGIGVGSSMVEEDKVNFCRDLIRRIEARGKKILLPVDHKAVSDFADPSGLKLIADSAVPVGMMGIDIGPKTVAGFAEEIKKGQMVFWNGPMGVFETPEYAEGTFAIAKALSECPGFTIVGGGDSASAAQKSGVADLLGHISTGGGASLEYLQGAKLPGIEAIRPPKRSESIEGEYL